MAELRQLSDRINDLLIDATEIEQQARHSQAERPSSWSDDETRAFRNRYQSWYGSALESLPEDLQQQFIKEFQGGRLISGIQGFISNPTQPNAIFAQAALDNPESISSLYWQFPLQTTFEQRFFKQQALLRQARERYTILSTIPDEPIFGVSDDTGATIQHAKQSDSSPSPPINGRESQPVVFIAHGRSLIYLEVHRYLKDELGIEAVAFETQDHTSEQVSEILNQYLDRATAAVIVMTGEEQTIDSRLLARQNVVHEAGLFQAKLGFDRVALLKEASVESFSNAQGLIYIPFDPQNITSSFYDLRRFLAKLNLVSH